MNNELKADVEEALAAFEREQPEGPSEMDVIVDTIESHYRRVAEARIAEARSDADTLAHRVVEAEERAEAAEATVEAVHTLRNVWADLYEHDTYVIRLGFPATAFPDDAFDAVAEWAHDRFADIAFVSGAPDIPKIPIHRLDAALDNKEDA